ncbi:HAD superfamily hydrolase (TIGR01490 family) [Georgenia soli]|uniref:HAD superfamily hydrolase (TIGR01490 family) n=1 Tax=Georgenia soli TaxID=638953 RepID=A0A2A9EL30_9MICO|nr:HAD family hydrolase [Georgenia soli]PFG39241.1 HAD superfamily hydrolase (TIGR01490 family) [Georgenia soli]
MPTEGRPAARTAAFFDLDKTVLARSSSLALGRPLLAAGLLTRADVARSASAQLGYALLAADHRRSERVREQLSRVVDGWEVARLQAVVEKAVERFVEPYVYLEAIDLVARHHDEGSDVVIVSASSEDLVAPIARLVGADHVVASRMEVVDGRYTGQIDYYAYGPAKAAAVRELAADRGYDLSRCWAYSDSVTDLPMLEAVGRPVAVNPDRALLRLARERGWEVRRFVRPVPLLPGRDVSLGLLALCVAAGLTGWWLRRRGRPPHRPGRLRGRRGRHAPPSPPGRPPPRR